jgi:hypothetical protein
LRSKAAKTIRPEEIHPVSSRALQVLYKKKAIFALLFAGGVLELRHQKPLEVAK